MLKSAETCDICVARVTKKNDLMVIIQKMFDTPWPYLLNVSHQEHVLPMISRGDGPYLLDVPHQEHISLMIPK